MQFSSILSCAAVLATALAANAFTAPLNNTVVQAGANFVVRWEDTDGVATINLLLRQGDPDNLSTVLRIAQDIPNQGAVQWSVPDTIPQGDNYALEIQDASNTDNVNYSPFFTIDNNRTITSSSSSVAPSSTSAEPSSTVANSTSSAAPSTTAVHHKNSTTKATGSSAASTTLAATTAVGANSSTSASATKSASENGASKWGSSLFAAGLAVAAALAL